jgi:preprotein translocase subunit SecD
LKSQINLADGSTVNPDGTYQTRDRKQLKLHDGECLNLDGQKFQNLHQQRKMMVQKNMQANKKMMKKTGVKKPVIKKKKGKKSSR